jgi:hypothetical protein
MATLLQVYAGQQVVVAFNLTVAGVPADPSAAVIRYQDVAGVASLTTLSLAALTRLSAGQFTLTLDTTSFVGGVWDVQILASGAVDAVGAVQFQIFPRPLG